MLGVVKLQGLLKIVVFCYANCYAIRWRIANVVPLFKKGSRDNPGNYRPVSCLQFTKHHLQIIFAWFPRPWRNSATEG